VYYGESQLTFQTDISCSTYSSILKMGGNTYVVTTAMTASNKKTFLGRNFFQLLTNFLVLRSCKKLGVLTTDQMAQLSSWRLRVCLSSGPCSSTSVTWIALPGAHAAGSIALRTPKPPHHLMVLTPGKDIFP
jgi:hypothetical protein